MMSGLSGIFIAISRSEAGFSHAEYRTHVYNKATLACSRCNSLELLPEPNLSRLFMTALLEPFSLHIHVH